MSLYLKLPAVVVYDGEGAPTGGHYVLYVRVSDTVTVLQAQVFEVGG